jgi:hypothetical protein
LYKGTLAHDFGSISAGSSLTTTLTVTGAAVGDPVAVSIDQPNTDLVYTVWVSATNTVTIKASNYTGSAVDPVSTTFQVIVLPYASF